MRLRERKSCLVLCPSMSIQQITSNVLLHTKYIIQYTYPIYMPIQRHIEIDIHIHKHIHNQIHIHFQLKLQCEMHHFKKKKLLEYFSRVAESCIERPFLTFDNSNRLTHSHPCSNICNNTSTTTLTYNFSSECTVYVERINIRSIELEKNRIFCTKLNEN